SSSCAKWTVVCVDDGRYAFQADSGNYLARCNKCAPGAAYPDQAFVHVKDWQQQPWAQWRCFDYGDGKIGLQADSGKYLARCYNCIPGAYPNSAFVHESNPNQPWAQWTVDKL
ncbi:unnamed protein product, partial [Aphanomyces euteiches]